MISSVPRHTVASHDIPPRIAVATDDDALWLRVCETLAPIDLALVRLSVVGQPAGIVPDVLVLHLPDLGREALAPVRELSRGLDTEIGVVLICDQLNVRGVRRAVDAGCNGLILSAQVGEALAPTVTATLVGQICIPRDLGPSLHRAPLSFREKEIVGLAVLGYTNGQIGRRLFLAESTVKSHLSSSFAKLGVSSRNEASAIINDPDKPLGDEIIRIAHQLDQGSQALSR